MGLLETVVAAAIAAPPARIPAAAPTTAQRALVLNGAMEKTSRLKRSSMTYVRKGLVLNQPVRENIMSAKRGRGE